MASDLDSLIARLEAATEGSRELDALIYVERSPGHHWKHGGNLAATARQMEGAAFIPRYTTSLDAAVTLIPEGQDWLVHFCDGSYLAAVGERIDIAFEPGHTAALALVIASLKARAPLKTEEHSDGK